MKLDEALEKRVYQLEVYQDLMTKEFQNWNEWRRKHLTNNNNKFGDLERKLGEMSLTFFNIGRMIGQLDRKIAELEKLK